MNPKDKQKCKQFGHRIVCIFEEEDIWRGMCEKCGQTFRKEPD